MKKCCKCLLTKPLSYFHKNRSQKDGHARNCKICQRDYDAKSYTGNTERQEQIRAWSKRKYAKNRDFVKRYKSFCGCKICGEKDSIVLDLHHLSASTKDADPSSLYGKSRERLKTEIRKCVVLCANCHRRVHAGTMQV